MVNVNNVPGYQRKDHQQYALLGLNILLSSLWLTAAYNTKCFVFGPHIPKNPDPFCGPPSSNVLPSLVVQLNPRAQVSSLCVALRQSERSHVFDTKPARGPVHFWRWRSEHLRPGDQCRLLRGMVSELGRLLMYSSSPNNSNNRSSNNNSNSSKLHLRQASNSQPPIRSYLGRYGNREVSVAVCPLTLFGFLEQELADRDLLRGI